ncbi:MAG TPA: TonB-dependent receptor plug domain-containing protein [Cytophagales bacterium]|nr:TonB-dependent receptor plug domain-containing protein [Cytophagales bacterium]
MKNRKIKVFVFATFCLIGTTLTSFGQQVENTEDDLFELDLEQLMNIPIVSASKKAENLYDAPFSSSVLSKEEIRKAGCTSIMEAFKLMPGLIVREQTNGNYDIHIRGLDNVPPNSVFVNATNSTTLVMIDNRPVYNYLQGGTFWESLPVDLNDIEKIEIVRGPSSAMYGPNAASGVIHIITAKPEKDGLYAVSNIQAGTSSTAIANASVGYQFSSKLDFIVSGNYQNRERENTEYYRVFQNDYVTSPNGLGLPNPDERYPNPERSMNKYGANAFINYTPKEKISLNFAAGIQDSEVQKIYGENLVTPISTTSSKTHYSDLKLAAYDLTAQFSYLSGTQDPTMGFTGSKYDFTTLDGFVEYAFKIKSVTIKPGYNFRKANYDDTKYWDASTNEGIISGSKDIVTNAFSLRSDVKLIKERLRLFGGIRLDMFNHPDKEYFSYQFASTFAINDKNLIRAAISKATRSPFIYDIYQDFTKVVEVPVTEDYSMPLKAVVSGDKNLKLVTSQMVEIGYRSKLAKNIQLDLDVFRTVTTNYTGMIQGQTDLTTTPFTTYVNIKNLPLEVHQVGATLALNTVFNKFQFKPFVTIQNTELKNYSIYSNTADAMPSAGNPTPQTNNYLTGTDKKHESTPGIYGGAYLNYQVTSKLNVNLSPYFFSSNTFYYSDNATYMDGERGVGNIDGKLVVNGRVSYKLIKQLDLFVSGKNIFGDTSREFYRADNIGVNFLGGLNFQL